MANLRESFWKTPSFPITPEMGESMREVYTAVAKSSPFKLPTIHRGSKYRANPFSAASSSLLVEARAVQIRNEEALRKNGEGFLPLSVTVGAVRAASTLVALALEEATLNLPGIGYLVYQPQFREAIFREAGPLLPEIKTRVHKPLYVPPSSLDEDTTASLDPMDPSRRVLIENIFEKLLEMSPYLNEWDNAGFRLGVDIVHKHWQEKSTQA